jgi:hypothetical protein
MGKKSKVVIFLHQFRWPVLADGHRWIKGKKGGGPKPRRDILAITPVAGAGAGHQTKWYAPLRETPALFRTFADIVATEEGILNFANRFGMLGGAADSAKDRNGPANASDFDHVVLGQEPLTEWLERIFSMRQAIALRQMATSRDVAGLRKILVRDQETVWLRPKVSWLLPDWRNPDPVEELPKAPPWFHGERINAAEPSVVSLEGSATERGRQLGDLGIVEAAWSAVAGVTNRFLRGALDSRLYIDAETGQGEVFQDPDSLGSALWLQFANSITEGTRFRTCKTCGEWFALPLRGSRVSREYCTDACRFKAYRDRQDEARRLAAKGVAPAEIARKLDTTASVVRKWLKSGKGK